MLLGGNIFNGSCSEVIIQKVLLGDDVSCRYCWEVIYHIDIIVRKLTGYNIFCECCCGGAGGIYCSFFWEAMYLVGIVRR